MPVTTPYILVSPRMLARVDVESPPPYRGVVTQTEWGHHAIWAATIPYIPAVLTTEQVPHTFGTDATDRIRWLLDRQTRFLYALAQITNQQATFELRYVADPRPSVGARVMLVLLGKSFTRDPGEAEAIARAQWERVAALFPSEAPFHYPLVPVTGESDAPGTPRWEADSFAHWFEPITDADLDTGHWSLIELRKHEDWPRYRFIGQTTLTVDYIPHPFVPRVEYTAVARLLEVLAHQARCATVAVTLRPQRPTAYEEMQLTRYADWYEQAANGHIVNLNPAMQVRKEQGNNGDEADFKRRASFGKTVYEHLAHERQSLFLAAVRIVADPTEIPALTEALGSQLIANNGQEATSTYDPCMPEPGPQTQWARFNMRWLEMERWGISREMMRMATPTPDGSYASEVARFRFFVTVHEANAAFRLPTAPPDDQLDGLPVRDEPFTAIVAAAPEPDDVRGLGNVTMSGAERPIAYHIPGHLLAGGACVLGDDSLSRAAVARALLAHFIQHAIPTIVLGPYSSVTMRGILADFGAQASAASPDGTAGSALLSAPPVGVSPASWAGVAALALALCFEVPTRDVLPLRAGLVHAFTARGADPNAPWSAQQPAPRLDALVSAIAAQVQPERDDGVLARAIRERCLPALREVARAATAVTPCSLPALNGPVLLELDTAGTFSTFGAALAAASAITALEQATRLRDAQVPRAALMLIEPDVLVPRSRASDQPLLAPLVQLRQLGGAIVLLTARPHTLDPDLLSARLVASVQATGVEAISTIQHLMRLNERETHRMERLTPQEVLWHRDGTTTLVRLPDQLRIEVPWARGRA